jgi:hypothetical protein
MGEKDSAVPLPSGARLTAPAGGIRARLRGRLCRGLPAADTRGDRFPRCVRKLIASWSLSTGLLARPRPRCATSFLTTEGLPRNGFVEKSLLSSIIASHFRLEPSLPESALRGRSLPLLGALVSRHVFGFLNTAPFSARNPWTELRLQDGGVWR